MAQARFLETGKAGKLFATLERGELDPEQAAIVFAAKPVSWPSPCPSGEGFELVRVLRRMPASFDEATHRKKRDARMLAEACKLGAYKPAHRTLRLLSSSVGCG